MPAHGTPAIDALRRAGVAFEVVEYEPPESHGRDRDARPSYGLDAAAALGVDPARMFKTLIATADVRLVAGLVPVDGELDLKRLAAAVGARKAVLAEPAAAERATGYVVGGISPLGGRRAPADGHRPVRPGPRDGLRLGRPAGPPAGPPPRGSGASDHRDRGRHRPFVRDGPDGPPTRPPKVARDRIVRGLAYCPQRSPSVSPIDRPKQKTAAPNGRPPVTPSSGDRARRHRSGSPGSCARPLRLRSCRRRPHPPSPRLHAVFRRRGGTNVAGPRTRRPAGVQPSNTASQAGHPEPCRGVRARLPGDRPRPPRRRPAPA